MRRRRRPSGLRLITTEKSATVHPYFKIGRRVAVDPCSRVTRQPERLPTIPKLNCYQKVLYGHPAPPPRLVTSFVDGNFDVKGDEIVSRP